jgi:hypothetical protein
MSRLSVRLFLLIACLSAIGGAVFHLWSSERRSRLDAQSARQFSVMARRAIAATADLRAAQQAYVAAGQGPAFWFDRVTAIHADLELQLTGLRRLTQAADIGAGLDDAAAALSDFVEMDQRARELAQNGELTRAADMIFADGIELTQRASEAIARAASSEQMRRDAAAAHAQKTQVQALAGAAGVTVLGLFLLLPAARRPATPAAGASTSPSRIVLPDFDEFRPPVRPAAKAPAAAAPSPPPAPPAPAVNIGAVATLCNDLARVADTRALPALLERAASVLDATGVIVWIADPDGRELAPILVHGYSPQLATRLGTIARDATNLTASAYRTGLLQTVKADAISSGAIAVPLVAATGCVGVMAAEVKNGGEQQEDLLAAATIVAAQLATLAGPPSARAKAEAAS